MLRTSICAGVLALASSLAPAQEPAPAQNGPAPADAPAPAPDPQWEALKRALEGELRAAVKRQTDQLQNTIALQERRISELERRVRALEAVSRRTDNPLPVRGGWRVSTNWGLLHDGMPESVVRDILGEASRVDSVVDKRVLYYDSPKNAPRQLHGSVTLIDDRVTDVSIPAF